MAHLKKNKFVCYSKSISTLNSCYIRNFINAIYFSRLNTQLINLLRLIRFTSNQIYFGSGHSHPK